jgi:hypothetical protein
MDDLCETQRTFFQGKINDLIIRKTNELSQGASATVSAGSFMKDLHAALEAQHTDNY